MKYTNKELESMRDSLIKHLQKVKKELSDTEIIISKIEEVLDINGKSNHDSFFLTSDFFNCEKYNKPKISWKKIVYLTIQKSDRFLNSIMLFEKIRIQYPMQLRDRRYAIKSISSALVNLGSEGKVGKIKSGKLYFFGDTSKHFKHDGRPDLEYFKTSQVIQQ